MWEAGELGNEIKKLYRFNNELKGSSTNRTKIADEVGDVMITLTNLCTMLDIDIEKATVNKFNKVSEKYNFNAKMAQQEERK